jgi:O-antigen/teichoic acid export membrane protein
MNRSAVIRFLRQRIDELPPQSVWTFAIRIAAAGVEFACLMVLARVFPSDAYGTYVLVMSCLAIAVVPATVGFDRLLVREVAALQASANWSLLKGILRRAAQIAFAGSLVVMAILLAGTNMVAESDTAHLARAMQLAIVLVPLLALARLRQATLQGLDHMIAGLVPESIVQPAVMILLAGATAVWLPVPHSGGFAVVLQVIASLTALTLGLVLLRRCLPQQLTGVAPAYQTRQWLTAGLTFMWLVGMSAVLTNADTILVGTLMSPTDAGVYRVATQLAMFVGLPLTAVSIAMAPAISALHATGRREELRTRARNAARTILLGATGIALGVALFGPWVLKAFGPAFAGAYIPAMILVVAYWIHASMATASYLLFMTAHERAAMLVFTAGIVVNIGGNLLLIPAYGMAGAAAATGASLCFVSITCAWLVWRLVGINATVLSLVGKGSAR